MGDRHGWSVRAGQIVLVLVVVFAGAWPGSITAQPAAPHDVAPLPGGCGRVTPPGAPEPTCCINGMVIIDGQAVAGAAVTITTDQGDRLTTFTQVYPGPDAQPIYRLSLSAPPLTVEPGQLIHITARYSSHERTIEYMVQPGSQQVDLALARHQADDYAYQRAITSEIAPGAFKRPTAIATDRAGDVYVLDRDRRQITVFSPDGAVLRQWGGYGNGPGQFTDPSDLTVDRFGNVYVTDSAHSRVQKFSSAGGYLTSWRTEAGAAGALLRRPEHIGIIGAPVCSSSWSFRIAR
jgi:hypothetical protein